MYILGVHYGHDATLALMKDGEIIECMSEERLTRLKKYVGFPHKALAYIEKKYGVSRQEFGHVYVLEKDLSTSFCLYLGERENKAFRNGWKGKPSRRNFLLGIIFSVPLLQRLVNLRGRIVQSVRRVVYTKKTKQFFSTTFPKAVITYVNHHEAHAYAAVPFLKDLGKKYLVLTLDGGGDNLSGSINLFSDGVVKVKKQFPYAHSLGFLYGAVTGFLGMTQNEHEFKVMGLAPYAKKSSGEKVYEHLKEILFFDEEKGEFAAKFHMKNAPGFLMSSGFTGYRFDSIAYGIQKLCEEIFMAICRYGIRAYGVSDVVVAGGTFMNVKGNQRIQEMENVSSLTCVPSCGDESLAIGLVCYGYLSINGTVKGIKPLSKLYLGSEYSDEEIRHSLEGYKKEYGLVVEDLTSERGAIEARVAELLAKGEVVARLNGRAEWGARALGNRSILANPSNKDTIQTINEMIKNRDFWMPFAASILEEDQSRYLKNPTLSPFMAITFSTEEIAHTHLAAATHPYDKTCRAQIVRKEDNPSYHRLISIYKEKTGMGGILNTSFNLHGEPNVESPVDALETLIGSGLKYMAIGNYLVIKP